MPICYDTAAHTGSQSDHNKIFHALSSTIHHFADSCCIRVIGQVGWQLKFILNKLGQWNDTFPWQIWRIVNRSGIKITIRRSDTYTPYPSRSSDRLYQCKKLLM